MRGHIRRRGEPASSTSSISARPRRSAARAAAGASGSSASPGSRCPRCGGELAETEERRRAIKGGYATRRECEAALAKILAALETQSFTPPTKVTVKQFLLAEWLPTVKGSLRPTTYASYAMLASEHIIPRPGQPAAAEAHARRRSTPSTPTSQNTVASMAAGRSRPPRYAACTPSCTAPATTPCAGDGSASTRWLAPIRPRPVPSTTTGCRCGRRSSSVPSSVTSQRTASTPSGACWP